MSEKVGLAGNIQVPLRQASTSSVRSDDAVPTTDPNDVSCGVYLQRGSWANGRIDVVFVGRTIAGVEACLWIFGGVHRCNCESPGGAFEGV